MKFTVNVDCTPEEARSFLGLPDVQPLQEEMMEVISQRLKANMESMDPETIMKMWMPAVNQSAEHFQNFLKTFMDLGSQSGQR